MKKNVKLTAEDIQKLNAELAIDPDYKWIARIGNVTVGLFKDKPWPTTFWVGDKSMPSWESETQKNPFLHIIVGGFRMLDDVKSDVIEIDRLLKEFA